MWLSLLGFLMCMAIMFLIDWISSVITLVVIFALYLIVVYRKPGRSPPRFSQNKSNASG